MRKSDFTGCWEVFRFSLIQGLKEKTYFGFLIIASIVMLALVPVSTLILNWGKETEEYYSQVSVFTVYDEVGLNIDYNQSLTGEAFKTVRINGTPGQTFVEHVETLKTKGANNMSIANREMLVHIVYEETGHFQLSFVKAPNTTLQQEDCKNLAYEFIDFFEQALKNTVVATDEQLNILNRPINMHMEIITDAGKRVSQTEEKEGLTMGEYLLMTFGVMLMTLVIHLSSSKIAISIVTEKSTRVVEYLAINVRPMALVTGKILATLMLVLIQLVVMVLGYLISVLLNGALFGYVNNSRFVGVTEETFRDVSEFAMTLSEITLLEFLVAVVILFAGILFFSILAGVAGAAVSKLNEINEGLMVCNLLMIAGVTLGMVTCSTLMHGGKSSAMIAFCCLFPISSPFVAPISILLGKVPLSLGILSIVILLVITGFLFSFASKVYEAMIFYNGKLLKLKDILQIAKNR